MSCKKDSVSVVPTVKTISAVAGFTATEAIAGGEVLADGGDEITACGVCWSSVPNRPSRRLSTARDWECSEAKLQD